MIHSIFNGNSAYAVGGFYNVGTLTVKDSTITNNSAISFAGTPGYTASPGVVGGFYNIGRPNGGVGRPSPNETAEWRGRETTAERNKFATKAVAIRGRSTPTLQHARAAQVAMPTSLHGATVLRLMHFLSKRASGPCGDLQLLP